MALTALKLAPGINTVKTPLLNEGSWSAASNIRFFEGIPQKDAGFALFCNMPGAGIPRSLEAWTALSNISYLGIGGTILLDLYDASTATVYDITPAAGWANLDSSLANWGEFLLACPFGGPVYVWMPSTGTGSPAVNVPTAPQVNNFIFVATQEEQLICCGSSDATDHVFDPMLLAWSDVGDYTSFIPLATNQAGSFRLPIGSKITAGLAIGGQNLIWTDLALYSMQYIQPPLVYGFQPLGLNCGAVGQHVVGTIGGVIVWMGYNQFFLWLGEGVQQIECPVWDSVFANIDRTMQQYIVCKTDSLYGEVGWSVPQMDGSVVYARVNLATKAWTADSYHHHTAWIDQNVFGAPLGGHETEYVDQHDVGFDALGLPAPYSITTSMITISEGDQVIFVRELYPDFKGTWTEMTCTAAFFDYPESTPRTSGPFTITPTTQAIFPRGRGRQMQLTFSGNDLGSNPRFGMIRYRGQPDGRR